MAYKNGRPNGPCILCNTRRQRTYDGLCDPCRDLTRAEGTYNKVALRPDPLKARHEARVAKVKQYNRLMRKGFSFQETAAQLGVGAKALSNFLLRAKRDYGLKPVHGKKPDRGHGVEPYGLAKCKCLECKVTRNRTRRAIHAARRAQQMPS